MSKKAVIIIAVVAAILIIGAVVTIVLIGSAVNSVTGENSQVTYNYEVKDSVDSFSYYTTYGYYEVKAPAGSTYAVIKIIEKNNNCSSNYTPLSTDFKFKCSDGKEYFVDTTVSTKYSSTASGMWSISLAKGQTYQYTVLSQIPVGTSVTDVVWNLSSYTTYRDTGLKIDSAVGNQEKGTPSVLYNFKYDKTSSTIGTYTAGAGKTYVVYALTEKNNNLADGFTSSIYDVKIKCTDGNTYSSTWSASTTYADTSTALATTLALGNSVTFHVVFEIPTTLATGTTLVWEDLYSGQLDSTLPVVVP